MVKDVETKAARGGTVKQHRGTGDRGKALSFDTTLWIDRLERFEGNFPEFIKQLLAVQCLVARASAGAIIEQGAEQGSWSVLAARPSHERKAGMPDWLSGALKRVPPVSNAKQAYLKKYCAQKKSSKEVGKQEYLIYLPLIYEQAHRVMGVFYVTVADESVARDRANGLKLTQSAYTCFDLRNQMRKQNKDMTIITHAMEVLDRFNEHSKYKSAAMVLCHEVATVWRADRVALGLQQGAYVKMVALNQTEHFSRKMQLIHDLEGVMEESYDQDIEVFWPASPESSVIARQAKRLSDRYGPECVYSFPLRREGEVIGVLTVEMPIDRALDEQGLEGLRLLCNLVAPRVDDLKEANKWIGTKLADSAKEAGKKIVGPTHTWVKVAVVGLSIALGFLFFWPVTDTVESPFMIDAVRRQVIAAPFDGYVEEVYAEPGDVVTDDQQVLATLSTGELRLRRASLVAELAQNRIEADIARREGNTVDVHIAQAKADAKQAEIGIVDDDIEDAAMRSPMLGIVIDGNLKPRTGGAVQRGEVLYEVAPIDSLRAELYVPEDRINDVELGQRGELSSAANPGRYIGFVVESIEPIAQVRQGQNVFLVRVKLDGLPAWMRPGMQGLAKVDVGTTSMVNKWTRGAVNWVRMKLWI
ncbi:HlyD family efflux transporter periplasmic adaptor subunit [Poriferisphaera sp. WC338]|uniref:HlyD family efflux transporter periplasmic adaptor subunit n=1 Tax=Poriferisphaera sp. WC338 TaxID=3425129 RepID=UPI003D8155B7